MPKILVGYVTRNNHTKKVADLIADELAKEGVETTVRDLGKERVSLSDEQFDGIVLGAPVYMGSYPHKFAAWVKANASFLRQTPTAFFSVCLGILQKDEKVQREERAIVEQFFHHSQWYPVLWTIFPGALSYSKYNRLVRWLMQRIARAAGNETVMTRDYEFTDWSVVGKFARSFAQSLNSKLDPRHLPPSEFKL